MRETDIEIPQPKTNPFLTVLILGAAIAALVASGSYVSKQRADQKSVVRASVAEVVSSAFAGR